jgi:hypothetical protein
MESDEAPSRSIEEIAKDLQNEHNPQRICELAEELRRALKEADEKKHKSKGVQPQSPRYADYESDLWISKLHHYLKGHSSTRFTRRRYHSAQNRIAAS